MLDLFYATRCVHEGALGTGPSLQWAWMQQAAVLLCLCLHACTMLLAMGVDACTVLGCSGVHVLGTLIACRGYNTHHCMPWL